MRKIVISIFISVSLLSSAWAEERDVDVYAAADEIESVVETTVQPDDATVMPPSATVDVPVVIDTSKVDGTIASGEMEGVSEAEEVLSDHLLLVKKAREERAALHIALIFDEVDAMEEIGFFGNVFVKSSEFQETIRQDIELFLVVYADLPVVAKALYLRGEMQRKQGLVEEAAMSWLHTIFEYSDSDAARRSRQALMSLLESEWDKFSEEITAILGSVPESEDAATRLSSLINQLHLQLYPMDEEKLVVAFRSLQLDFLEQFPDDSHADEVQVLLAHNAGPESAESGVFGFKKLLALYPDSAYRAEALLSMGDLQRLRLKEYAAAEGNYQALIQAYPKHRLVKNAYENLALTQKKYLKKYAEAIANYQTIVDLYPEETLALTSLQSMASLQEKKMKQPVKAIESLRKLATMFRSFEAVDALKTAIKIAQRKVKDPALTFEIQSQLLNDFPNSKDAPKVLFAMAEYAEKEEDYGQAKILYRQLIRQYSDHRLAKNAEKALDKL